MPPSQNLYPEQEYFESDDGQWDAPDFEGACAELHAHGFISKVYRGRWVSPSAILEIKEVS
jgi:hypothetical protein